MTTYVTNAFSVQMLSRDDYDRSLEFVPCSASYVADHLSEAGDDWIGCIGHADTAAIAASQIGVPAERLHSRVSVTLRRGHGDCLLVAQYRGPRLPEGATTLPAGAAMEWWLVQ